MYASIFRIVVLFPIILFASLAYGQSLEIFGIDILAATRSKVTGAVLEHGAEKLPSNDSLIDRYNGNAIFPGARMKIGFNAEDALERIVFQFDSGSWFTDVLNSDDLKQILFEKYGQPVATPVENRNSDFEEELKWEKNGIKIHLVSYKWFAAWRIHVTHRLSYFIPTHQTSQEDGSMGRISLQRQLSFSE